MSSKDKKPKVALGISYFNSVKELPRLLDPIHDKVDLIIGVDGRYPLFNYPHNISNDGSNELLISKYGAIVQINKSPIEQIDKRNQYMEIADNAGIDFVLVLDADDYLHSEHTDWDRFFKELQQLPKKELVAFVWFWMNTKHIANWNFKADNTWVEFTRIIRPQARYDGTHYYFIDKDKPNDFIFPVKTIDGIRFDSDSVLRDKKYTDTGYTWAKQQMDEETARLQTPKYKRKMFKYLTNQLGRAVRNAVIIEGSEILDQKGIKHITNDK